MNDSAGDRETRRRRTEAHRALATWLVFGAVSFGSHHLALQFLDVSGLTEMPGRPEPVVMLDLFEPDRRVPSPPPDAPKRNEPPKTEADGPKPAEPDKRAEPPRPAGTSPGETGAAQPPRRTGRPGRNAGPRVDRATEAEVEAGAMILSSEYGDPYDPLNPQLRMTDWGSARFGAAERFFDATDDGDRRLVSGTLRSPFEHFGGLAEWMGNVAMARGGDFFDAPGEGIRLAINPDRPDVLKYAPVDASVVAYLNLGAIHGTDYAEGVAGLLRTLPEYQTMVGEVEARMLAAADELYVTSSDPTDRAKTVVIIRHRLGDAEIDDLIGQQIALAGALADWTRVADRRAVTVDARHAETSPWLYLFPETGVVVVVHRNNLAPVLAALDGREGRTQQRQVVEQLRRMTTPAAAENGEPIAGQPPTLFALADSGTLESHLRFFARQLADTELADTSGGYLRLTGGERPVLLGGLKLEGTGDRGDWVGLMQAIEGNDLARSFEFTWAGREDRILFRLGLTTRLVDSSLGLFRVWADRFYRSDAVPELQDGAAVHGENVIGTAVGPARGPPEGMAVCRGPDGRPLKECPDGGTPAPADGGAPGDADGGTTITADGGTTAAADAGP